MKTKTRTVDAGIQQRALAITPKSIDADKGTVEGVFATDLPVRTYNWDIGYYHEVLGFKKEEVRMDRINTSAPLLDNHIRGRKLGTVDKADLGKNSMTGIVRFDLEDETGKKEFGRVQRGFTKTFSVGYKVYNLRYMEDAADGLPIYRAIDWEPIEMSTADIPADINAGVRNEDTTHSHKLIIEQKRMEPKELTPEEKEAKRIADESAANARQLEIDNAVAAERTRGASIREIATKHIKNGDKAEAFIKKHVDGKSKLDAVREDVLNALADNQPEIGKPSARVTGGFANDRERSEFMVEGVLARLNERKYEPSKDRKENPYRHRTLMEICDDFLIEKGLSADGSPRARVARAMNYGAQRDTGVGMSTSDFPNLFANVLHKILRKEYQFQTGKWKQFSYEQDGARVNQPERSINLGDFQEMKKVTEGAEYQMQSVSETAELFTVNKYGSEFAITDEMIINDDLGGIERMGMKAAKANEFTEDFLVWNLLFSNPNMSDGNAVFSSQHNNLASGTAMAIDKLFELWKKVRAQTGLNGKPLDISPAYVLCGLANAQVLSQILNPTLYPTTTSAVVPTEVRSLKPIVTNYITGNGYYVFAEPRDIDTIRYGGLIGEPGFTLAERYELRRDSWIYHARKFFGASFTDFRGMAFNPGQ